MLNQPYAGPGGNLRFPPIGMLIKTSLVDYPGHVAAAVFLHGCNLRCPYCYNTDLVTGTLPEDAATFEEIARHLEKRRGVLTGLAVSGGEALLSPWLVPLIEKARALGYAVKLDTNGMMPARLKELIDTPALCPDFIALDVKTAPARYAELLGHGADTGAESAGTGSGTAGATAHSGRLADGGSTSVGRLADTVTEAIRLVGALPPERREFRTVLVPHLVTESDIDAIGALLPRDSSWQFAPFRNDRCIDPRYEELDPYLPDELTALVERAKRYCPAAALR